MSIDTRGPEFAKHAGLFALPQTLIGGTQAMRQAGTTYLPKGSAEADADYQYRLAHTFCTDAYVRTLNYLTGQVFARDPQLDGADASFDAFAEDVDKRGNNLAVFSQSVFRDGLHAGVSFILADYSAVQTRTGDLGPEYYDAATDSWKPRTVAAAKEKGWGPYWVHIQADSVIDAWWDMVGGKPVLTHFRFYETVEVQKDEWNREEVKQIRVLTPGAWAVWRESKSATGKASWEIAEQGATTLTEIPVAIFAPGQKMGLATAQPALMGLAELCHRYWIRSSGLEVQLDWLQRGLVFGKCLSHEDGFTIPAAPGMGIHSTDPNADLRAVNVVDPKAVEVSEGSLDKIKMDIGLYGLRLMSPKSSSVTAFQIRRESAESDSALTRWAMAFQDTLEQALKFTAMWMGQNDGPSVVINTEFDQILDDAESQVMIAAVEKGILPKEMVFDELKRRGLVRSEIDWEEAQAMMEQDARSSRLAAPASAAALASGLLGQTGTQG